MSGNLFCSSCVYRSRPSLLDNLSTAFLTATAIAQSKQNDCRHSSCAPFHCAEFLSPSPYLDIVWRRPFISSGDIKYCILQWKMRSISVRYSMSDVGCLADVLRTKLTGGVKIDLAAAWQAGAALWSSVLHSKPLVSCLRREHFKNWGELNIPHFGGILMHLH